MGGAPEVVVNVNGPSPASAAGGGGGALLASPRVARHTVFADGRFVLQNRIGSGAFGDLYQAIDTRTKTKVAVKLEKRKNAYPQLSYESKVYRVLHHGIPDPVGIPRVHYYDTESDFNVLVMDLCGPSLEDLFNYCGRRLSLKTVCMIADQILSRLEFLHTKGFIHRDIKPENFVFGTGKKGHILHLIDYGLSKLYWDKRKQTHIPFCEGKPLTGTARYCSAWTHRGYEQSRRDDLEAVSFMVVYFLVGVLPWQGITVKDPQLKTIKIGEKKIATSLEELCSGLPEEIKQYCTYCRELNFADKPDYAHLRELFATLARRLNFLMAPPASISSTMDGDDIWTSNKSTSSTQVGGVYPGYDWMFDWFVKRKQEVREGRKRQQLAAVSETTLIGASVSNTVMCDESGWDASIMHVTFSRVA